MTVVADSAHEAHEGMRMWAGMDFEPELFDIESVKKALMKFSASKKLSQKPD
jgi:hypothetical protein